MIDVLHNINLTLAGKNKTAMLLPGTSFIDTCQGFINMAMIRRKSSDNLLDTADDLVDRLDNLADILAEIEDTYEKSDQDGGGDVQRPNIFRRLKDGLDSARSLIACLKREKWRINERKMSVDMRMGELEDYKGHLKEDMTNLNMTVDDLARRLMESENANCEAQEAMEELEMEKSEVENELEKAYLSIEKLKEEKDDLMTEIHSLRRLRSDSTITRENIELRSEIEVLQEERHTLKAIIREMEANKIENNSVDGGSEYVDKNLNALRLTRKNSGHSRLQKRDSNSNTKSNPVKIEETTRIEFV